MMTVKSPAAPTVDLPEREDLLKFLQNLGVFSDSLGKIKD
jgi:hypothetical protein